MFINIVPTIKSEDKFYENRFQVTLDLGMWKLNKEVTVHELELLRDEINEQLGYNLIAEKFKCSLIEGEKIFKYNLRQQRCKSCSYKGIGCFDCVILCQSPLEQDLLISFYDHKIKPELQVRINKDGSIHSNTEAVDKENILTIPDFYLSTDKIKLCVYADGHTYHERTEYQAVRDRSIDRELQNLGFEVLRYTGKEIRSDVNKAVQDILKRIN